MIVFLFPGQGTQRVGMYNLLGKNSEEIDEIFKIAQEATGRDIKELCTKASDAELKQTLNTQLSVTAMNMAYAQLLANRGVLPDVVAGHSLGQFSALAAAGVISVFDLFRIVEKRAELMEELQETGKLATVVGLDKKIIDEICEEVSQKGGQVRIALENSEQQFVIGGKEEDVDKVVVKLKQAGAIKIVEIRVSNAFHTYLMEPMVEPFHKYIDEIEFQEPKVKILLNAKGDYAESVQDIKEDVVKQCVSVVKWKDCLRHLLQNDNVLLAETGVGKTMASLVKGMRQNQKTYLMSSNRDFDQFINIVKEGG